MRPILILALLTLAACGADGIPVKPDAKPASGVSITGEARVGVETKL